MKPIVANVKIYTDVHYCCSRARSPVEKSADALTRLLFLSPSLGCGFVFAVRIFSSVCACRFVCLALEKKQQLLFMASFESLYFILTLFLPLTLEIGWWLYFVLFHCCKMHATLCAWGRDILTKYQDKWITWRTRKKKKPYKKPNSRASLFCNKIWKLIAHFHYDITPENQH